MTTNNQETEVIDESFLLASIKKQGEKKENISTEPQTEQE